MVDPGSQDLGSVAAWMSEHGLGEGPITDVTAITGGTQNIMLRLRRSGRDYVFRRGPRHLRPVSNAVILRETRVLRALADTDVPHPGLIAVCADTSVLGDAVFYLMEPVDGFNAGAGLPALQTADAGIRHGMGLSMADAAARLGAVDHVEVGLGDFGKPEGFLDHRRGAANQGLGVVLPNEPRHAQRVRRLLRESQHVGSRRAAPQEKVAYNPDGERRSLDPERQEMKVVHLSS